MPEWIRDEADYQFRTPGNYPGIYEDCRVHVTAVMDRSEAERPKLFLEDAWDNEGPSVEDGPGRDACIRLLSAAMKIEPGEADWFTRGKDGQLQAVSIGYEQRTQTDPQYARYLAAGEFSIHEAEDAKRFFPDVAVSELRTGVQPADRDQRTELAEAFRQATSATREPAPEVTDVPSHDKSGHEYDLSQEYLR